jgi:hypothetical protein
MGLTDFVGGHWLGIILGIIIAEYMTRKASGGKRGS